MDERIPPQEHWLLAGVPKEQVMLVLEAGREVHFAPGAVILREGEAPDGVYLLTAGWARITSINERGEVFLGHVRANEVLGEMGVLDGEPRSGTATAMTESVAYFVPTATFIELLEGSSQVCNRLLTLISARLRRANQLLMSLSIAGPVTRRALPIAP